MLHPRNPPDPKNQIPRYLAVQIQIEILFSTGDFEVLDLVDFRGVAFSVESVIARM